ncbi:hypothetical protein DsansV1_C31g0216241 [Dioscorea sansibarensis]
MHAGKIIGPCSIVSSGKGIEDLVGSPWHGIRRDTWKIGCILACGG